MAVIIIVANREYPWTMQPDVQRLASASTRHRLTDDPQEADVGVFADCHIGQFWSARARLQAQPDTRSLLERGAVFVYDERDLPRPVLPGVYTSLRRVAPPWAVPHAYLRSEFRPAARPLDCASTLYGFLGSDTHPLRRRLATLNDDRGSVILVGNQARPSGADERYEDALGSAKFALCPRGHGPSSFRIFEAMARQRVPVVISDDWVPPAGPAWSTCSIRIPEAEADNVGDILLEHEDEFPELAARALLAFNEHFSADVAFDRLIDAGLRALAAPRAPSAVARACAPYDARRAVRRLKGALHDIH